MTVYTKPDLPNPGGGRYWTIEAADGYFTLRLMIDRVADYSSVLYPVELASSGYLNANDVSATSFETIATKLLDTVDKNNAFVGTYTFEETK